MVVNMRETKENTPSIEGCLSVFEAHRFHRCGFRRNTQERKKQEGEEKNKKVR